MKRLVFLSLLGAFVASSACATQRRPARVGKDPLLRERRDSSPVDDEAPLGRLPADVLPLEYDLNLVVDPRKETFSGFAAIGVRLTRPRNHLWLHGVALQVKQAQVTLADGSTRRVDYQQLTPDGVVRISFRGQLEPQDVRLVLAYDAQFNRSAIGVFRRADGGREFAFTRFEATEARRAFPCFDEPGTKTPYRLTLTVPGEMEAFSNTAVELERKSADGKVRTLAFRQTEPLPTYQVAFAVGEFDVLQTEVGISSVRSQALKLRGIAIRGKEARLRKAMERVAPSVVALENYLGTAFPYEKLDMIAVPSLDLRGTWNAGLVGLSEARLFVDTDDVLIRDRLDHLLLRSLAGQWFGGLVTHLWWDELWLSEAFPAWLASRVAVTGESSGSGDRSSGASLAQAAMRSDRLSAARSVREPVSSTRDVRGAFDGVTETKGAAVLAMFEGYVGAESFQRALRQYLQKFAHGSAGTAQWLETLKDASKRELAASFMSFLTQSGVPLVETRLLCDAGRARLDIRQSRSIPLGSQLWSGQTWRLPLCVKTSLGERSCSMLNDAEVSLEFSRCPAWVMPNAEAVGYYRFGVDESSLPGLLKAAQSGALNGEERMALIDSMESAFFAGKLPAKNFFDGLRLFAGDSRSVVVKRVATIMKRVRRHLVRETGGVDRYLRDVFSKRALSLGLEPKAADGINELQIRSTLIELMVFDVRDPRIRTAAALAGKRALRDEEFGRAGDLLPIFFGAALQSDGEEILALLLDALKRNSDPEHRQAMIVALTRVREPGLVERVREFALSDAVASHERLTVLTGLGSARETASETWLWFRSNFRSVVDGLSPSDAGRTPEIAGALCDEAALASIDEFFADRIERLRGGPQTLGNVLETVGLCSAQRAALGPAVDRYFGGDEIAGF